MTVICAAIKNGQVAIAADTQISFGSMYLGADYIVNSGKLLNVNSSVIGLTGYTAIFEVVEQAIHADPSIFRLG